MDELPPNVRALLDAARSADDPSPLARVRADAGARAMLSRHGAGDLPPLRPLQPIAAAPVRGGALLKLGAGALSIATLAIGVWYGALRPAPPAPPSAPPPGVEPARAPIGPVESAVPEVRTPPAFTRARPAKASGQTARRTPSEDPRWLERELHVIESADALIRRNRFDAALQLLARTEPAVASHRLSEERDALAILARCGKRPDAAGARAREQFLNAFPRSVLAARVRGACAAPRKASD